MKLINVHRIVYLKIYKQEKEINDDFIESNKKILIQIFWEVPYPPPYNVIV